MNIKEIELASDMPRATIRYYEKEGIINPERKENGYRDYSEEDLKMLQKVKLLRQLDVSLDQITNLQNGTATLEQILEEQMKYLENEQKKYIKKKEICSQMQNDGYSFKSLNAIKYIKLIEEETEGNVEPSAYEKDKLINVNYPIRRFVARMLDVCLYQALWSYISLCILRMPPASGLVVWFLNNYIGYVLMLGLEALQLSLLGTTLGKTIFGLKVLRYDGKKLKCKEAFRRTWLLFVHGMGCGIPGLNLWCFYRSYNTCIKKEDLEWEYDWSYSIKDTSIVRICVAIILYLVIFIVDGSAYTVAKMPIHRGDITKAEFAENMNDMKKILKMNSFLDMSSWGGWVTQKNINGGIMYYSDEIVSGIKYPKLIFTEVNGVLTGISFEVELENYENIMINWEQIMDLMILSYAATDKSMNCFELHYGNNLISDKNFKAYEDFSYEVGKYVINCDYEYKGWEKSLGYLVPVETENYFGMRFEIMEK